MWWGWGSSSTDLQIPSSYPTRWMDPASVLFSFTSSKARGLTLISLPLRPLYLKPPLPSPLIFLYNSDCDIQATHDNPSGSLGNNTDPCSHSKSIEFKRLGMTPPRPSTSREYQDGGTEPYLLRLCVELITSAFAPHPQPPPGPPVPPAPSILPVIVRSQKYHFHCVTSTLQKPSAAPP